MSYTTNLAIDQQNIYIQCGLVPSKENDGLYIGEDKEWDKHTKEVNKKDTI